MMLLSKLYASSYQTVASHHLCNGSIRILSQSQTLNKPNRILINTLRTSSNNRRVPENKVERRLDIVIIGAPNAGKSALLNTLLKTKLAATSHKKHTTRSQILGVFNHKNIQLAFYDTPGFVSSYEARKLDTITLQRVIKTSASSADVVIIMVDAVRSLSPVFLDTFAEMVKIAIDSAKMEIILVLNKVDLVVPKSNLLDTTRALVSLINGVKLGAGREDEAQLDTTTFMISALYKDGVLDLKNYLLSIAKYRPWILGKNKGITSLSDRGRVNEVILQALLENTHEELPYICTVDCTDIKTIRRDTIEINADIFVDTPNQQRILVGHQGRTLVIIRATASELLLKIFNKEVILKLWIKVRGDDDGSDKISYN